MNTFPLTDNMILRSFDKTGVNEKYFPIYKAEVLRRFKALQEECPDDEDTTEEDANSTFSLSLTDDHIKFYAEESDKGHSNIWCHSVAIDSVTGENEYWIIRNALDKIENVSDKKMELKIHAVSINSDPIFIKRYLYLFHAVVIDASEKAEDYCRIYHSCIEKGKSETYAHAYADVYNNDYKPFFCEIYARAYELAKNHGLSDNEAYCFGESCTEAADQGLWSYARKLTSKYNETWQRDFFFDLMRDEFERGEKRKMTEQEEHDFRKDLI